MEPPATCATLELLVEVLRSPYASGLLVSHAVLLTVLSDSELTSRLTAVLSSGVDAAVAPLLGEAGYDGHGFRGPVDAKALLRRLLTLLDRADGAHCVYPRPLTFCSAPLSKRCARSSAARHEPQHGPLARPSFHCASYSLGATL